MRKTQITLCKCKAAYASTQCDHCLCYLLTRKCNIHTLCKIPRLLLASVAEQAGLSLTKSQTCQTGFLLTRFIQSMRKST